MTAITLDEARRLDKHDALAPFRSAFALPEGVIYLDGNSLGPLPRITQARLAHVMATEWGTGLIRSWSDAGWIQAQRRTGDKIGRIIGAHPGETIVADSTSVNLFKLILAAIRLRPGRMKILLEANDFPTDLHMAEAAAACHPGTRVVTVPRGAIGDAIDAETALVVLCHVHYRSGARHDMAALTETAHRAGALTLWDLSHSAGAISVDLAAANADLAVGCGYKFLNGGPRRPSLPVRRAASSRRHRNAAARLVGPSRSVRFRCGLRPCGGAPHAFNAARRTSSALPRSKAASTSS